MSADYWVFDGIGLKQVDCLHLFDPMKMFDLLIRKGKISGMAASYTFESTVFRRMNVEQQVFVLAGYVSRRHGLSGILDLADDKGLLISGSDDKGVHNFIMYPLTYLEDGDDNHSLASRDEVKEYISSRFIPFCKDGVTKDDIKRNIRDYCEMGINRAR